MTQHGIILDIGGTLLDTNQLHRDSWTTLLTSRGLHSAQNVKAAHDGLARGLDTFTTARLILGEGPAADRLARAKQELVSQSRSATAVQRTVRWLDSREDAVLAAITYSDESWSQQMLQAAGILERFAFVLGRVNGRKTDKVMLLQQAMQLLRTNSQVTSLEYIGDTVLDREIAATCGIFFRDAKNLSDSEVQQDF